MTGKKVSPSWAKFPNSGFIGFDFLSKDLDFIANHATDNYPPHNVIKTFEDRYEIEIAVAGFNRNELNIELKDQILTVTGEHESEGREFIHRGISMKKFKRSFRLSEYVNVIGADIRDGLLVIELKYVVPEEMRPRKILIGSEENENVQILNENSE